MHRFALDPWRRKIVQITCADAAAAAALDNDDAIILHDEFRVRNRGQVFVLARPDDNIWQLGYEALQVIPDMYPEAPTVYLHRPGHA
jgi:hypothetical protein